MDRLSFSRFSSSLYSPFFESARTGCFFSELAPPTTISGDTMDAPLNHTEMYRLPWTLPDNAISWLEPTSQCNLACDGCYRENVANSHKSLDAVRDEVET